MAASQNGCVLLLLLEAVKASEQLRLVGWWVF